MRKMSKTTEMSRWKTRASLHKMLVDSWARDDNVVYILDAIGVGEAASRSWTFTSRSEGDIDLSQDGNFHTLHMSHG